MFAKSTLEPCKILFKIYVQTLERSFKNSNWLRKIQDLNLKKKKIKNTRLDLEKIFFLNTSAEKCF